MSTVLLSPHLKRKGRPLNGSCEEQRPYEECFTTAHWCALTEVLTRFISLALWVKSLRQCPLSRGEAGICEGLIKDVVSLLPYDGSSGLRGLRGVDDNLCAGDDE